jgi:hypothetical protein
MNSLKNIREKSKSVIKEETYHKYLGNIDRLMRDDPKPGSPKHRILLQFAKAVERYEKFHFPIGGKK